MDYVASKERFGLRRGGKFNYIIDLEECRLIPEAGFTAARAVYTRAMELGLPDYNLKTHEGFLRYVVVRRSPDDQLLLAAVTAAPDADGVYAQALEQLAVYALAQPGVCGFHWLINAGHADMSFGTPQRSWGAETLPMRVGPYILQIGPNTFFQNNVYLLDALLDDTAACVGMDRRAVADLYGGVGTIAENGLPNVRAVAADVLPFLREQPSGAFDVVVADPPRIGLGPEVCAELLRLAPERLVYVSCNPLTQLDDARALAPRYRMTELRGSDMFPHTPHLETLTVFERTENRKPEN
jgi:tRNA/tmRNA/rRNA uracil-C5-methylase (TrmA/RlmC/RlmD family)